MLPRPSFLSVARRKKHSARNFRQSGCRQSGCPPSLKRGDTEERGRHSCGGGRGAEQENHVATGRPHSQEALAEAVYCPGGRLHVVEAEVGELRPGECAEAQVGWPPGSFV